MPAVNHGSCIYHLGLAFCFNGYIYHNSLKVHLKKGTSHFHCNTTTTTAARTTTSISPQSLKLPCFARVKAKNGDKTNNKNTVILELGSCGNSVNSGMILYVKVKTLGCGLWQFVACDWWSYRELWSYYLYISGI